MTGVAMRVVKGVFAVFLSFSLFTCCAAEPAKPATKPNILFIFANDLGWKDVGYQGSDYCETLDINKLAREGLVFPASYSGGANCMPSRACLLSGYYTPRHHVYAVRDTDRGQKDLQRVVPIPNGAGLSKKFFTMAEALKAVGYATDHFGKWHLSGRDGAIATEQSFDESFDSAVLVKEGGGKKEKVKFGNNEDQDPKAMFTLANKACEFIERNKITPFSVTWPIMPYMCLNSPGLPRWKDSRPNPRVMNKTMPCMRYVLMISMTPWAWC